MLNLSEDEVRSLEGKTQVDGSAVVKLTLHYVDAKAKVLDLASTLETLRIRFQNISEGLVGIYVIVLHVSALDKGYDGVGNHYVSLIVEKTHENYLLQYIDPMGMGIDFSIRKTVSAVLGARSIITPYYGRLQYADIEGEGPKRRFIEGDNDYDCGPILVYLVTRFVFGQTLFGLPHVQSRSVRVQLSKNIGAKLRGIYRLDNGKTLADSCKLQTLLLNGREEVPPRAGLASTAPNLFTRLDFFGKNEVYKFHSHELLRVANFVVNKHKICYDSKVYIPNSSDFEVFITKKIEDENDIDAITGKFDDYLIIPLHISQLDSIQKWLSTANRLYLLHKEEKERAFLTPIIAQAIKEEWNVDYNSHYEVVQGWWLEISGRLILIRNTQQDCLFYVSDHGYISDIVKSTKELVFGPVNWLNKKMVWLISKLDVMFTPLSEENQIIIIESILKEFSSESPGSLRAYYSNMDDSEIKEMQASAISTNPVMELKNFLNSNRYVLQSLAATYNELFKEESDRRDIDRDHGQDADRLIKVLVLTRIAIEVNKGKHDPLFRPVHSYGSQEKGATYPEFANTIAKYLATSSALPQYKLAEEMRGILGGGKVLDDTLSFLPNLIAAWFVAEPVRRPAEDQKSKSNDLKDYADLSIVTGMMLLDLIENQVPLMSQGHNLYDWRYCLVSPDTISRQADLSIEDLYLENIRLKEFEGTHPRAHFKSGSEHLKRTLSNGQKLTPVRQKEGSIIIHWLSEALKHECSIPIDVETESLVENLSYVEIDRLLTLTVDTPTKAESKNCLFMKKLEILRTHIIPLLEARLTTLENLLTVSDSSVASQCTLTSSSTTIGTSASSFTVKTTATAMPATATSLSAANQEGIRDAIRDALDDLESSGDKWYFTITQFSKQALMKYFELVSIQADVSETGTGCSVMLDKTNLTTLRNSLGASSARVNYVTSQEFDNPILNHPGLLKQLVDGGLFTRSINLDFESAAELLGAYEEGGLEKLRSALIELEATKELAEQKTNKEVVEYLQILTNAEEDNQSVETICGTYESAFETLSGWFQNLCNALGYEEDSEESYSLQQTFLADLYEMVADSAQSPMGYPRRGKPDFDPDDFGIGGGNEGENSVGNPLVGLAESNSTNATTIQLYYVQ